MSDTQTANAPAEEGVTSITIQGLEFTAPQPYRAGPYELSEGEASALNQTLAENLRNNFAGRVKAAKDEYRKANGLGEDDDVPVSGLDIEALQEEFDKYADEYEFGVRRAGGGTRTPVDPVEREAHRIALDRVKEAFRKENVKISSVPKERLNEIVKAVLGKYPDIREIAKRRVEEQSQIVLSDLNL